MIVIEAWTLVKIKLYTSYFTFHLLIDLGASQNFSAGNVLPEKVNLHPSFCNPVKKMVILFLTLFKRTLSLFWYSCLGGDTKRMNDFLLSIPHEQTEVMLQKTD